MQVWVQKQKRTKSVQKLIFGILLCRCKNDKYLGTIIDDSFITCNERHR